MSMKPFVPVWLKVTLTVFLLLSLASQMFATEGLQELEPYRVWMTDLTINRSTLSPERANLSWVIKENGLQELARLAQNETAYTYWNNRAGIDFVAYLDCWKIDRYARTSNTLGYRVGVDYRGPIISSEVAEVTVVNKPYVYQITATGSPTKLLAKNLPEGLTVDPNGRISGTPTQTGRYLVTLYAENNRDWTMTTLRLDVASGNNGGGSLDYATLVIDEKYVVTRTPGDGLSGNGLSWIVKRNGIQALERNALSETRYQYYSNLSGYTYTVHLECLGERVSNIVTYTPPNPVFNARITSPATHTGVAGEEITPYGITTDFTCNQFSASGLPSGLNITASGSIYGVPTEYGSFPVTVSASGPSGVASKTVTFTIQQGTEEYTTHYHLTIDLNHVVTRTTGEHPRLVWVVTVNQNKEVVRRSATEEYTFLYNSDDASEHIQVRLEAWIKGKYRPVSNTVNYNSDDTQVQTPLFSMAESYTCYEGEAMVPLLIQVSGNPTSITVAGLPQGLYYDATGKAIKGTPTVEGTTNLVITAINTYGKTTFNLEFVVMPDTRIATEDRFHLAVLPGFNIKRTPGSDESLRWVVYRNGQRIYEYPDAATLIFNYKRHSKPGEFNVFLEAFVDGEFARVSNIVGYRTVGDGQAPVLMNDRKYLLQTGAFVSIELKASEEQVLFAVDQLPAGLTLDSETGLISGTPAQIGITASRISVTGESGVSQTVIAFEVIAPKSTDTYLKKYVLGLDELNRISRSPGYDQGLVWVIKRDGQVVLERNAYNELAYTYFRNHLPGAYTCCLKAYLNGAYRQVSNSVEYTVKSDSDFSGDGFRNLVEHAMGTRAGTDPHQITPNLVNVYTQNGSTYLTYRYSVNTDAQDVSLFVDSASSLNAWTRASPISVAVVSADENTEVRDVVFCINSNQGFLRLVAKLVE